ncbi:type II toxin-antitoxin system RelE/ParE family toxin [Roseomonas stagni]|uniref:Type II toxin-antitoxin system RelE/ParE family toxin n=1 Tax=Falsiroseomonas algicola TaxID=2716930 RepID=A0A6M1LSR4_9PROT|nr:type II toxin-antitoxin system RelE/ParE family toxin [Falsiroseomonas algicola]NGM23525.1 type II toxin-antitoxin system RelE/ParE family toxin [Falsiroseomonas algicola]
MRLRFLPEAIADLVAVRDHVATYRPDSAGPLVDRLIDRVRLLAEHPEAGERLPRLGPGIRRLTAAPYLILYRIEAEEVRIVRILHGARRVTRRLLPPG